MLFLRNASIFDICKNCFFKLFFIHCTWKQLYFGGRENSLGSKIWYICTFKKLSCFDNKSTFGMLSKTTHLFAQQIFLSERTSNEENDCALWKFPSCGTVKQWTREFLCFWCFCFCLGKKASKVNVIAKR